MVKKYNQYLKENNDYSDIDPYGEEIWDEEELNPILSIAKKLGKPYDQITSLDCSNINLDSLEGIENLINLENLHCPFNNLTNLDEIENLINLKVLSCWENSLTSLNGVEKLINLKTLNCSYNNLTNLNGIENLINLKHLFCHNNNFSNEYKKYLINYCKKKNIELILW
jgi:Leucine-rich repeat (LRR) protein